MNDGLPGCPRAFVMARIELVVQQRRGNMARLLEEVDQDEFWTKTRYGQIVRLLDFMEVFHVAQTDIAKVMDVSNNLVTRYKKYHREHPDEERQKSGRPSQLRDAFGLVVRFIDTRNAEGQAVTMAHVLTYVTDELKVEASRKALWRYLIDHGFVYKLATPRDGLRIVSRENEIV